MGNPRQNDQPDRLQMLTTAQAAALLAVHHKTVARWCAHGLLPAIRTPGGHWRVSTETIRTLAAHLGLEPATLPPHMEGEA